MATRREFIQSVPAVGAAFAVAGRVILDDSPATAQTQPQSALPLKGHFHPKGKAPSKFTIDVLKQAHDSLPFADTRDLEFDPLVSAETARAAWRLFQEHVGKSLPVSAISHTHGDH